MMKIKTYINTDKKEVSSKKFNVLIGISIGNKIFTKENIKKYLLWALNNSNNHVLVIIADKINAINYEVRNKYSKKRALLLSLKKGEEINFVINAVVKELPEEMKDRVLIIRWIDVEKNKDYIKKTSLFHNFFLINKKFHDVMINIVRKNFANSPMKMSEEDYEKLALYPLNEIYLFVCGFKYKKIRYNLIPYPGLGDIDYLSVDLQKGKNFPELTKQLKVKDKIAILEAYP